MPNLILLTLGLTHLGLHQNELKVIVSRLKKSGLFSGKLVPAIFFSFQRFPDFHRLFERNEWLAAAAANE